MEGPRLVEQHDDTFGRIQTRWMCDPPPKGVPFRVTHDEWIRDGVRVVYAWEPVTFPVTHPNERSE